MKLQRFILLIVKSGKNKFKYKYIRGKVIVRLRPYKNCDAAYIVKWIKDEVSFRKWCADRYDKYPISLEVINSFRKCLYIRHFLFSGLFTSLEVFNNYRSSEESSIKGMCKAYRFIMLL